ncbi:hypothetical protein EVAR_76545_1 [Eumeta japonica]|uniref:Uncharacterized protein n=1 Tax=Eumeta variegata TaxID=151549 RepID=A0A4C1T8A9_EUMVA|nr:hypothetical protein EVAR_76545_1 [Eumeta japonica]
MSTARSQTGGDPPAKITLTPLVEKIIQVIRNDDAHPLQIVPTPFSFVIHDPRKCRAEKNAKKIQYPGLPSRTAPVHHNVPSPSNTKEQLPLQITRSVRVGHTPCVRAHGLSIMDFWPSLPFARAEIQKKQNTFNRSRRPAFAPNGRATALPPRPPRLRGRAERCVRVGFRRAALRLRSTASQSACPAVVY